MKRIPKNGLLRSKWKSTLGFILSTSGAAVGLGNIQRFPYLVAEGGGAAFLFIYIFFVLLLGVPLILAEFSVGRYTEKNPICAIKTLAPKTHWKYVGYLGVITAFCILSYYSVIAGWSITYIIYSLLHQNVNFEHLVADPISSIGYMALFIALTMVVVIRGVQKGIERYSKILMPLLLALLLILVVRSLTLTDAWKGIEYYMKVDFSEVTLRTILLALGQAFFSLCIGEAVLVTYGSYASSTDDLLRSASYIVLFDTLVAFLAGLVIFPALFSFGNTSASGIGLSFIILPKIFLKMPLGYLFQGLFFLLLSFAAITTSMALMEMPVVYFMDSKRWSRKKAVWVVGIAAFLLGIPSALSRGAHPFLTNLYLPIIEQKGFCNIMDFVWGSLGMVLGGGLMAIFVAWIWGIKKASAEIKKGSKNFAFFGLYWELIVKYVAPVLIFFVLLSLFV